MPGLSGVVSGVEVHNAGRHLLRLVTWALRRFERAGLTAPRVTRVTFKVESLFRQAKLSGCGTWEPRGWASFTASGGSVTVVACPDDWTPSEGWPDRLRRTLLHELAHVWIAEHVGPQTRDEFLALLGLDAWNGDGRREKTGIESAAQIVAWGLMDDLTVPRASAEPPDCPRLAKAYELLTGMPCAAPREGCDSP